MRSFLPAALFALALSSCAHHVTSRTPRTGGEYGSPAGARSCRALSDEERQRVLSAADPENFPATRYRKGPNTNRGIEKETDCSHFVHEVYRRAGLPFGFRPTADLGNAREFDLLPESQAQPGDLMLFRGHVGIVGDDGKIISAVRTRRHKRKSSIAALDRKYFKSIKGQRYVLRYRCPPDDEQRELASQKKHQP